MESPAVIEARRVKKKRKAAKQAERARVYAAEKAANDQENARAYIKWRTSDAYADSRGGDDINVASAQRYLNEIQTASGDTNPSGQTGASGPMGSVESGIIGAAISIGSIGMIDGQQAVADLNAYAASQQTISGGGDSGEGGNVGAGGADGGPDR
jgi:hypothetical protein